MSHVSLETRMAGYGEGSMWERGSPEGWIWGSKRCRFDVAVKSSRMGCSEITCLGSIQSAGRGHSQVWAEVIEGSGTQRFKGGRWWQEEASSRAFTKAQAHTDSSDLVVTIGWVLRGQMELVSVRATDGQTD